MAPVRNRLRAVLSALMFAVTFVWSALRERPRLIRHIGGGPDAILTPQGRFLPAISGGAPDEDGDKGDKDKEKDKEKEADKGSEGGDEEGDKVTSDDDWKAKSRKNETRAKKAERERDEAAKKLSEREEEDQSESERKISEAEKKGREEAESKAEKERKGDRLEVAVTRLASKKLTIGEGDDAKEVRFADTEDALLNIERAISKGEIDESDIFDDEGKVKTDALQKELADLLKRKPHLKDGGTEESGGSKGDPDTRKGSSAKGDLEEMSPEEHAQRKYKPGDKK